MPCRLRFYRIFIVLALLGLTACSSIDYFSHLAKGQLTLLWEREKVSVLLESQDVSDGIKSRLLLSQQLRLFAQNELALPVGNAYTAYTDLERPYVVWNVYAAPPLSFDAYTWCYPFLGCLAYRGFYDEQRAEQAAKVLTDEGYEVKVRGVQAYSTLGFFDDPLLNTFMFKNEVAFVELLIHEISHRLIYIKDDTKFNENFASAVAVLGAEQWYRKQNNKRLYMAYQKHKQRYQNVVRFLLNFKTRLAKVYDDKTKTDNEKYLLKNKLFEQLTRDYTLFKERNGVDKRYDERVLSMNNASLSTLANYQELVPGFIALFDQQNGNWTKFYEQVERLAVLDKTVRHQTLVNLTKHNIPLNR